MNNPRIVDRAPMSMVAVREELARIKKRDEELGIRGERTSEYLGMFAKMSRKEADDLQKAIEKLEVPRLSSDHVIKIVDMLPDTEEKVKVLFQGAPLTITKEHMKKIAETVKNR